MPRRTALTLWTAVAAAVFLLGSLVATIRRLLAGGTFGDCVALAFALTGMLGALLVAG